MPYKKVEDEIEKDVIEFDLADEGETVTRKNSPVDKRKDKWSSRTNTTGFVVPGNRSDITMLPAFLKLMTPSELDIDSDCRINDVGNNQFAVNVTLTIDKDDYKHWKNSNLKSSSEAYGRED